MSYYSTAPFLHEPDNAVKYGLCPTSPYYSGSIPSNVLFEHHHSENMRRHLQHTPATFDFRIQLWQPGCSIEDASEEWPSPFLKVAELRINDQIFFTGDRMELAKKLRFNVGHALKLHKPLAAMNRSRVKVYQSLAEFRQKRDHRQPELYPEEAFKATAWGNPMK